MGFQNGMICRVALVAKHSSVDASQVTTLHYDLQDEPLVDPNDPQALADTIRDDVTASYRALFTSSWNMQPVVVTQEKDPLNPDAIRDQWTSGTVMAGTRASSGDAMPAGLCGLASVYTGKVGRSFRGRIFLPGTLFESDWASGAWQSGIIALWQAFLNAIPHQPDISPPVSTSTANWCVYSRTRRARNLAGYAEHVESTSVPSAAPHYLRSREL